MKHPLKELDKMGMYLIPCHRKMLARIGNNLLVVGSRRSNTNTDRIVIDQLPNVTSG